MSTRAAGYVSLDLAARFRRQAWKVWAIGLGSVILWLCLIVAAPVAKANGLAYLSSPIYSFFGFLCHQFSDRSFHVEGEPFAVCSRCFGVYAGLLIGFVSYPFWRRIETVDPLPRVWLFLSIIPITIDWALTFLGIWDNTHLSRFVTGGILGFACGTFIVPSIVEITRNLTRRRTFVDSPS